MTGSTHRGCAGSKIILLGEHAVVHGEDALVLGMQKGVCATARWSDTFSVRIPAWSDMSTKTDDALMQAFGRMFDALKTDTPTIALDVTPSIPARAGMGASAALGVASVRAIDSLLALHLDDDDIFKAVLAFENVFHHNSSGVDIRAAAQQGCGVYNRHCGYTAIDAALPPLMVVHSGMPGATRDTVQRFARRLQAHSDGPRHLKQLGELVHKGTSALKKTDWVSLGALMNEAHRLLSWFDVSSWALDDICRLALQNGALGAKLTGGGGGGCAVILLEKENQRPAMTEVFQQAQYRVII